MGRRLLLGTGVLWVGLIALGTHLILQHQGKPGKSIDAPCRWPADSTIAAPTDGPSILVFLHPRCPCSHATLDELAGILARSRFPVTTQVFFCIPPGLPASWATSGLWTEARSIPGVQVHADPGGAEARRHSALTSGTVLLYDTTCRLRFAGGLTPARGHRGDCAGLQAIAWLLSGREAALSRTPVFGCPLLDSD